jgi:hypothetical protein
MKATGRKKCKIIEIYKKRYKTERDHCQELIIEMTDELDQRMEEIVKPNLTKMIELHDKFYPLINANETAKV